MFFDIYELHTLNYTNLSTYGHFSSDDSHVIWTCIRSFQRRTEETQKKNHYSREFYMRESF